MTRAAYHSALHAPAVISLAQHFTLGESVALVHNLTDGPLPPEFAACDVFYADIPWGQTGLARFNERAGVRTPYPEFIAAVTVTLDTIKRPAVIVTGQRDAALLPIPEQRMETRLNGARAVALIYRALLPTHVPDTVKLLHLLADKYQRVGDFCCGYGRAGRIFMGRGKRFTLSDYNPACIGYIAQHAASWCPK